MMSVVEGDRVIWRLTMCGFLGSVVNGLHCESMRPVLMNARDENIVSLMSFDVL